MESRLYKEKKEMAYLGYFIVSEFANRQGVSKQYASHNYDKYQTIFRYKRRWYKIDEEQIGEIIYGKQSEHIDKFEDFGFKPRIKSRLVQNDKAIVDVKRINDEYVSIRFYNQRGDALCCNVNVSEIELIEYDGVI